MGLGFCIVLNSLYSIIPSFNELFNYNSNTHIKQLFFTCPFVLYAFLSELLCFLWDQVRVSPHKKKGKPYRRRMKFILQEPEMDAFLQLHRLSLDLHPSGFIGGKKLVKDTRVLAKISLSEMSGVYGKLFAHGKSVDSPESEVTHEKLLKIFPLSFLLWTVKGGMCPVWKQDNCDAGKKKKHLK